jgi:hypothetical protein
MGHKESPLVTACLKWLEYQAEGAYFRVQSGQLYVPYTTKGGQHRMYKVNLAIDGTPDICGCSAKGRFVGLECKAGTELSIDQRRFKRIVEECNGVYRVIFDVDDLRKLGEEVLL